MKRNKALLALMANDLVALRATSLDLEKGLRQLAEKTAPHDLGSVIELICHINAMGFAPIAELLRECGVKLPSAEVASTTMNQVLAEARVPATSGQPRVGMAGALSIARRAARCMEMACSSTAETAHSLRLTELSELLRSWSREWIGLEVTLNEVASRCIAEPMEARMRATAPKYFSRALPTFAAA